MLNFLSKNIENHNCCFKNTKKNIEKKHQIFKKHKTFILKIIQETQKKHLKKSLKCSIS